MPVLARTFEACGMSTVVVTNMPFWAAKVGMPRTLAVEFPFGHMLGEPSNDTLQMRVIGEALELLETAAAPGTIMHSQIRWPGDPEQAQHLAHPEALPPVSGEMGKHIGRFLRALRRGGG